MYERQALLIPQGMQQAEALVVGCGMLGSWTIHSLVRTMKSVGIFDMDTVGRENIGTQAFAANDETMNKALAMSMHLSGFRNLSVYPEAFRGDETQFVHHSPSDLVVVSAVDSFEARGMVARYAAAIGASLFIDTRADATVGVVVTVAPKDFPAYLASLESDETAPTPACGAEGTGFVGMWVAQYVTGAIARFYRGLPVAYKVVHDAGMDVRVHTEVVAPVREEVMA